MTFYDLAVLAYQLYGHWLGRLLAIGSGDREDLFVGHHLSCTTK